MICVQICMFLFYMAVGGINLYLAGWDYQHQNWWAAIFSGVLGILFIVVGVLYGRDKLRDL